MLSLNEFARVVENTPLVFLDLIGEESEERILLRKREYFPVKGKRVVPGGQVSRDAEISRAFQRLLHDELDGHGNTLTCPFRGVYRHFFDDLFIYKSALINPVFLADNMQLTEGEGFATPHRQRIECCWSWKDELLEDRGVNTHARGYFTSRTTANHAPLEASTRDDDK